MEFSNATFSLITEKWTSTRIVQSKPRHLESQGSVERANREIMNALGSILGGNYNDLSWVKYFKRVHTKGIQHTIQPSEDLGSIV